VAVTVIRMPLPVGGQQDLPGDGQFATESEESPSGRASTRTDAPMVVKGQFCWFADKTGMGRSVEGKLLLGHAPAGR